MKHTVYIETTIFSCLTSRPIKNLVAAAWQQITSDWWDKQRGKFELYITVTIYEVFKVVLRETSENEALQAAAAMQKGKIVDLTAMLAIAASRLSLKYGIPMADSIILATAETCGAVIWTQDSDFKNIVGVKYFPKKQGINEPENKRI